MTVIFDVGWFNVVEDKNKVSLNFDFSNLNQVNKSEAIDMAVDKVKKCDNLFLALSGGMDSEFTADCLYNRGVKFTPVLVDYKSNDIELWYAKQWCIKRSIPPIIYNAAKEDVLKQIHYNALIHRSMPGYFPLHFLKNQIRIKDGTLISGGPEPLKRHLIDSLSNIDNDSFEFIAFHYMIKNDSNTLLFLYQTPELFINFMEELNILTKTNSTQTSLAKYYNIDARPKIDMLRNIIAYGRDAYDAFNRSCALIPKHIRESKAINCLEFITRAKNKETFSIQIGENHGWS